MPLITKKLIKVSCAICCSVASAKEGSYLSPELSKFQQELSLLNSSSSVEPSGARSPGRISLSTGMEQVSIDQDNSSSLRIFPQDGKLSKSFISWNQGIFYPFSYGISIATITETIPTTSQIRQASVNLKWTFFESFGLPAISTTLQWSRVFGLGTFDLQSNSAQIQASWGYRNISFFSGAKAYHHLVKPKKTKQVAQNTIHSTEEVDNFVNISTQLGIHIQLIPAKLSLSIENAKTSFSNLLRGKFSYEF